MIVKESNIKCIWGGTLAGVLLKGDNSSSEKTQKIIGIHGYLDNLNSLLPISEKLIENHPNYEIYLYDRAGHGFSSHLPPGFEYSYALALQDLRNVIQTLGWNNEKFVIIGHSFGAMIGLTYAAAYPDEVICMVALDALVRSEIAQGTFWKNVAFRIDFNLKRLSNLHRTYADELTLEKAIEIVQNSRPGITYDATKLLIERSTSRDKDNKLHFTRDQALKSFSIFPFSYEMVDDVVRTIKAPVLFIGALNPQYPRAHQSFDSLKKIHPKFEAVFIDGPHHLHMTHVDEVVKLIESYFDKYFQPNSTLMKLNSKL